MKPYSKDNPEGSPWTFVSKQEYFDNWLVNHSQHKLLNVAGNPVDYTVIHFKNRAVGIAALEDGHITLVGQFRYALNAYSWELPEGGCPPGKQPLEAAHWELAEETGLRAEHFEPLLTLHTSNAITDEWAIVYLATGLSPGEAEPEENEVLQTRRISIADLLDEVESGKITDAMTVATAYKLALMQARGTLPA